MLSFREQSQPSLSLAGRINLYVDRVTHALQVSINGGTYTSLTATMQPAIRVVTSNTTLTAADHTVIADASAATRTLTLPLGVTSTEYALFSDPSSLNAVTVNTTGGQLIDGQASQILNVPGSGMTVQFTGTYWKITATV